jgi:indolepyruvate ferredoxin oxidoreductase
MKLHLAPPLLSRTGPDGRPQKREFGPWILGAFRMLAPLKVLRGTPLDVFGYSAERRMERALIRQYEADMAEVLPRLYDATRDAIVALAELPLSICGFGPVKDANAAKAAKQRDALLATIRAGGKEMVRAAE